MKGTVKKKWKTKTHTHIRIWTKTVTDEVTKKGFKEWTMTHFSWNQKKGKNL